MPANDVIALNSNYSHWQQTRGAGLTGVNPFDYYCVENFLKSFPVSDKELKTGYVDKSGDGGVDAFYCFANRKYIYDDSELDPDSEYKINIVIFQCKEGNGFSPLGLQKLIFFAEDLLDLGRTEENYKELYHQNLKTLMQTFKEQYSSIAGSVTAIECDFYYVSRLDVGDPEPDSDVANYGAQLQTKVKTHFPKAKCNVHFVGATKLFSQA